MKEVVNVKIYLNKKNQYVLKFKSSHLKGEMVCENIVHLDNILNKITEVFSDTTFNVTFSEGALGRYTWELDSPKLLFHLGFKFMGYLNNSNTRVFFNDELYELIVINGTGFLKKYRLN